MNVILIVIDTLRSDHLSCYGYFRKTSPNIDKLAEEGVMFKNSYATAIATGPGFSSIITGLSPIHHHYYLTPHNLPNLIDFDDSIPTLAEIIRNNKREYTTCAFDNLMNFYSHMDHLVRGYEYYINVTKTAEPIHHHIIAEEVNRRLIPWLEYHKDENMFLFIHYWDPHTPYNQPENYRKIFHHRRGDLSDLKVLNAPAGYQYVPGWGKVGEIYEGEEDLNIDLYDGEIRYVDHFIGQLIEKLKELKILEKTAIIITSDHGEQLGHHGEYGHSKIVESCIRIPLIFYSPKFLPKGKIIEEYVQQTDIVPTILKLLDIDVKLNFDGRNLIPVIEGKEKLNREIIFIENHCFRGLLHGEWKYIRHYFSGNEELYNLKNDPMEAINLNRKEHERLKEMRRLLNRWVKENLKGRPDPIYEQMAKWKAVWNATFEEELYGPTPKPTIIKEKHGADGI